MVLDRARFVPGRGLDARVASRFGVPAARRIAHELADRMRANAPDAGVWITYQDERVRPTHRDADGQTIPANLRYILDKPSGGKETAAAPRDPDLSLENRVNCRCLAIAVPGAIAERVAVSEPVLRGTTAVASVSVVFDRIVESEHPGDAGSGGGWVARSVAETIRAERGRA